VAMLKNWSLIIIGCLILGFQNCGRNGFAPEYNSSGNINQVTPGDVVDGATDESSSSPVTAVEIPTGSGPLTIQTDSGKITLIDQGQSQAIEQGCLNAKDLAELQSYTKTYNLCSNTRKADLCTQVYTAGYASLIVNNQKLNLGESFDGCGKGFKDFCGAQAEGFRGLVDYIVKNFPSMKCQ